MILVLAVAVYAANRRLETAPATADGGRRTAELLNLGSAVIGVVLGGLLFAGSLAAGDETSVWGIPVGAGVAVLGFLAVAALFGRARERLAGQRDAAGARALLDLYAEGIALALAALSIFVDVVGYLALVAFIFLIVRSRGERAQKYGGLRILR